MELRFPAGEEGGAPAGRRSEIFFWGFAAVALFLFLGHNALWASEDRWAEIAREMASTGDWLHPAINWKVHFDKPPLTYWLILPFAMLYGGFNELIVRLPGALAGLIGLFSTVSLGKKLFDRRTALLAGWMLLSSYGFLFWSRGAAAEMLSLAISVLAVAFFYQRDSLTRFWSCFGFCLIGFFGALAGGLPALVTPFVMVAPHLLAEGRWRKVLKFSNFLAFLLAGAICAAPVYFAVVTPLPPPLELLPGQKFSGLELIWQANVVELFQLPGREAVVGLLCSLPRCLLPWSPVILVAIAGLVRNWKSLPGTIRELLIASLLLFLLLSFASGGRWYGVLPLLPYCTLLGAAGIAGPFGVEKWNRPLWQLMLILVICLASLCVAALAAIPLWYRFAPFEPPLLLLVSLPVAGILTLCVMMFDSRSGGALERLTGMPFQFGAPVLGGAILVAALFDCVWPSFTIYRTEKPFYRAFRKAYPEIPPDRIFCWGSNVPTKMLFYLGIPGPVADSEEVPAQGHSGEAGYLSRLHRFSAFLVRNAGCRVAVLVYNRPGHRESFARAVKELNLPVDVQKPDFSEDFLEVIKSERDERNRNIWVFQVPEKTEEQ